MKIQDIVWFRMDDTRRAKPYLCHRVCYSFIVSYGVRCAVVLQEIYCKLIINSANSIATIIANSTASIV